MENKTKKKTKKKTTIDIERAWLERLITVAESVKSSEPVKISAINYLLGYIESAERILQDHD